MLATGASAATVVLDADSRIRGATGVEVNGAIYNVDFVRENCTTSFNGCPVGHQFTFVTEQEAVDAFEALSLQVFTGPFSDLNLIWGMEGNAAQLWTHYGVSQSFPSPLLPSVFMENDFNDRFPLDHQIFTGTQTGLFSIPDMTDEAVAVWTRISIAEVPLPASGLLLIGALAAMRRFTPA